jgi:hypothetical protein
VTYNNVDDDDDDDYDDDDNDDDDSSFFLLLLINGYGTQYNGMDLKLKVILTHECGQQFCHIGMFIQAILLSTLLNKPHLFSLTQHRFPVIKFLEFLGKVLYLL